MFQLVYCPPLCTTEETALHLLFCGPFSWSFPFSMLNKPSSQPTPSPPLWPPLDSILFADVLWSPKVDRVLQIHSHISLPAAFASCSPSSVWSWLPLLQRHTAAHVPHLVHKDSQFLFCQTTVCLLHPHPVLPCGGVSHPRHRTLCLSFLSFMRFFSVDSPGCSVKPWSTSALPSSIWIIHLPPFQYCLQNVGKRRKKQLIGQCASKPQTSSVWGLLCTT